MHVSPASTRPEIQSQANSSCFGVAHRYSWPGRSKNNIGLTGGNCPGLVVSFVHVTPHVATPKFVAVARAVLPLPLLRLSDCLASSASCDARLPEPSHAEAREPAVESASKKPSGAKRVQKQLNWIALVCKLCVIEEMFDMSEGQIRTKTKRCQHSLWIHCT